MMYLHQNSQEACCRASTLSSRSMLSY